MMNLFKTVAPWMVATLLVSAPVFGADAKNGAKKENVKGSKAACAKPAPCKKECPQPTPPKQMCEEECTTTCCPPWYTPVLNAGYGYPAATETRCSWDVYSDISFIYWQASQDNMEYAAVYEDSDYEENYVIEGLDFDFKPGFKLGMGVKFDHDNWDLHAGYTWFRSTQEASVSADAGDIEPIFGHPLHNTDEYFRKASQNWHLSMDLLDVDLGRSYYLGRNLTVRPSVGARAAFIRQNATTTYNYDYDGYDTNDKVINRSHSWGLGAKFAVDSNWLLGCGFRMFGNAEADVLYTQYTKLGNKFVNKINENNNQETFVYNETDVDSVRTHFDFEIGFGWGTYLDCNKYYLDFALGYGFQVFFDQNMFRNYVEYNYNSYSINPNGNLYVQGMTFTVKLDY